MTDTWFLHDRSRPTATTVPVAIGRHPSGVRHSGTAAASVSALGRPAGLPTVTTDLPLLDRPRTSGPLPREGPPFAAAPPTVAGLGPPRAARRFARTARRGVPVAALPARLR
ncbi:MAG TPA: hypothetical protein VJB57_14115 [Dehalococcoidia bacterium]|nr:hypothetical protein [Dehalococcoidia bacterium]